MKRFGMIKNNLKRVLNMKHDSKDQIKYQIKTKKQEIGQMGEDIATEFMHNKGFLIIGRNFWTKFGELDIVAKRKREIVFVEVKTVTMGDVNHETGDSYLPEENIHPWKLQRLGRAIEIYLSQKKIGDEYNWRLDSIAVYLSPEKRVLKIEHLENIF